MFEYLKRISIYLLFLYVLTINLIIVITLNLLNIDFGNLQLGEVSLLSLFVLVVFIAPLFETFLFNFLPIKTVQYFTKNKYVIVFLASIIFSLIHTYSFVYMIMTYIGGLGLNTFYLVTEGKKGKLKALGLTTLLHSVYNLIGFLLIEVFHVL